MLMIVNDDNFSSLTLVLNTMLRHTTTNDNNLQTCLFSILVQARLDLQLGSSPQDRLHGRSQNSAKTPTQLQISSDRSSNSSKTPVQRQNSSSSTSSEESSSLIYEERRKGRSGPRLPLPLPSKLPVPPYAEISKVPVPPYAEISKVPPMCMDVANPRVDVDQYENLPGDLIEEHTAQPGPDNPVLENFSCNEGDEKIVDDAAMEKTNPGRGFEEPLKKSNLRPEDLNTGQKCVAIAMGKIMHSPFPLMDKEEGEAVQRYLLADIGNISEIKITSLATEPEEDGLFLHQIQVTTVCPFSSTSNLFSYTFILINPHPGEVHPLTKKFT